MAIAAPRGPKRSKELTDKTFEHDTQATTGSTTGDWFVNFCAKKSVKACREIEPPWDELTEKLFGRVSVAHVDLDKNKEISQRFGFKEGQPNLWLFRRKRFYQYDGSIDDIDALHDFAVRDYDQAKVQGDIPQEPTALQQLWKKLLELIEQSATKINQIVMKNDKNVSYPAIVVFFGIPLAVIFGMCFAVMSGSSEVEGAKPRPANKVNNSKKKEEPHQPHSVSKSQAKLNLVYLNSTQLIALETPLITSGKQTKLLGINNDGYEKNVNNISTSRVETSHTMGKPNCQQTYQQSIQRTKNHPIKRLKSKDLNSPNLKTTEKFTSLQSTSKTLGQNLGGQGHIHSHTINSTSQPQNFSSPQKSNTKIRQQNNSQQRSARSNSSRDSSGGGGRAGRRSNKGSASRRSYSTDRDSQERPFIYPCQAFKQFLLTVKEGKIDMRDLSNSPFLIDYLTQQAQIGGGSGGSDTKMFQNTLRQTTTTTVTTQRTSSKSRDGSRNKKGLRTSNIGESSHYVVHKESIMEEDEEDPLGGTGVFNSNNNTDKQNQRYSVTSYKQSPQRNSVAGGDSAVKSQRQSLSKQKVTTVVTQQVSLDEEDEDSQSKGGSRSHPKHGSTQKQGPSSSDYGSGKAPGQGAAGPGNNLGSGSGSQDNFKVGNKNQQKVNSSSKAPSSNLGGRDSSGGNNQRPSISSQDPNNQRQTFGSKEQPKQPGQRDSILSQASGKGNQPSLGDSSREGSIKPKQLAPSKKDNITNPTTGAGNLNKGSFKEDQNLNNPSNNKNNNQPSLGSTSVIKKQPPSPSKTQNSINQNPSSSSKKPRRGRRDRSTSGDEARVGSQLGHANNDDSIDEPDQVRFDEKGRPIKDNKQKTGTKPKNNNKGETSDDDIGTGPGNSAYNSQKGQSKLRRGRKDRSSIDSEEGKALVNQAKANNPANQSPNEPRSISKLPKPASKGNSPQRTANKAGNVPTNQSQMKPLDANADRVGGGQIDTQGEDGTFRDYQDQPNSNDDQNEDRLPLFDKNTEFFDKDNYKLNALNDNQPKKYLKNKSPLKKQQFKEDEEEKLGLEEEPNQQAQDNENEEQQNPNDQIDSMRGVKPSTHDDVPKIGVSVVQKKTPLRESRKVRADNQPNQNDISQYSEGHNRGGITGISAIGGGPFGIDEDLNNTTFQNLPDEKGLDSQRSQKFKDFLESQNRSRSYISQNPSYQSQKPVEKSIKSFYDDNDNQDDDDDDVQQFRDPRYSQHSPTKSAYSQGIPTNFNKTPLERIAQSQVNPGQHQMGYPDDNKSQSKKSNQTYGQRQPSNQVNSGQKYPSSTNLGQNYQQSPNQLNKSYQQPTNQGIQPFNSSNSIQKQPSESRSQNRGGFSNYPTQDFQEEPTAYSQQRQQPGQNRGYDFQPSQPETQSQHNDGTQINNRSPQDLATSQAFNRQPSDMRSQNYNQSPISQSRGNQVQPDNYTYGNQQPGNVRSQNIRPASDQPGSQYSPDEQNYNQSPNSQNKGKQFQPEFGQNQYQPTDQRNQNQSYSPISQTRGQQFQPNNNTNQGGQSYNPTSNPSRRDLQQQPNQQNYYQQPSDNRNQQFSTSPTSPNKGYQQQPDQRQYNQQQPQYRNDQSSGQQQPFNLGNYNQKSFNPNGDYQAQPNMQSFGENDSNYDPNSTKQRLSQQPNKFQQQFPNQNQSQNPNTYNNDSQSPLNDYNQGHSLNQPIQTYQRKQNQPGSSSHQPTYYQDNGQQPPSNQGRGYQQPNQLQDNVYYNQQPYGVQQDQNYQSFNGNNELGRPNQASQQNPNQNQFNDNSTSQPQKFQIQSTRFQHPSQSLNNQGRGTSKSPNHFEDPTRSPIQSVGSQQSQQQHYFEEVQRRGEPEPHYSYGNLIQKKNKQPQVQSNYEQSPSKQSNKSPMRQGQQNQQYPENLNRNQQMRPGQQQQNQIYPDQEYDPNNKGNQMNPSTSSYQRGPGQRSGPNFTQNDPNQQQNYEQYLQQQQVNDPRGQEQNQSTGKKQRRGRANRGSPNTSQDRQYNSGSPDDTSDPNSRANSKIQMADLKIAGTRNYPISQNPSQQIPRDKSLSENPLSIQEHIDTYRSKTNSQLMGSPQRDQQYYHLDEDEPEVLSQNLNKSYQNNNPRINQSQIKPQSNIDLNYYYDGQNKSQGNNSFIQDNKSSGSRPSQNTNYNPNNNNQNPQYDMNNKRGSYAPNTNNFDYIAPNIRDSNTKLLKSPYKSSSQLRQPENQQDNQHIPQNDYQQQQQYNQYPIEQQDYRQNRGEEDIYRDSNSQPNLQKNLSSQKKNRRDRKDRGSNAQSKNRSFESSIERVGGDNDKQGFQNISQVQPNMIPSKSYQQPYSSYDLKDNNAQVNNSQNTQARNQSEQKRISYNQSKQEEIKRQQSQSRTNVNQNQSSTYNKNINQQFSQQKSSVQISQEQAHYEELIYQNESSHKYKSRVRELEDRLKREILENPNKAINYQLLQELQEEAARTIQLRFRSINKTTVLEQETVRIHGRFVDRGIQTDPINLFKLAAGNDMDKFRKFFFAVFYTYMMMNTIMAESLKK